MAYITYTDVMQFMLETFDSSSTPKAAEVTSLITQIEKFVNAYKRTSYSGTIPNNIHVACLLIARKAIRAFRQGVNTGEGGSAIDFDKIMTDPEIRKWLDQDSSVVNLFRTGKWNDEDEDDD